MSDKEKPKTLSDADIITRRAAASHLLFVAAGVAGAALLASCTRKPRASEDSPYAGSGFTDHDEIDPAGSGVGPCTDTRPMRSCGIGGWEE